MATFYRNRESGLVQSHPVSGLGDTFNADEVGEDGKPLAFLPISAERVEAVRKSPDGDKAAGSNNTSKDGDR